MLNIWRIYMINNTLKKQLIMDFYKAQLYALKYETEKETIRHIVSVTDMSDLLLFRKVNGIIAAKNDLKIDNLFMSVFLQNYNDSISIWANLFKTIWGTVDNKDYIQNIKKMFTKKSPFTVVLESLYWKNYLK